MSARTFYDILNVKQNASFDELKSKYKQLILQCHPDKNHNSSATTTTKTVDKVIAVNDTVVADGLLATNNDTKFVEINKAWNTLKDPALRKLYDAELIASRFQKHSNIFARLKLDDLDVYDGDDNNGTQPIYTYGCRCGGQYILDESFTQEARQCDQEICLECSECSLKIVVDYQFD